MKRFLLSLTAAVAVAAAAVAQPAQMGPRYVFLFIGDGMGMGHVSAASTYLRQARPQDGPLLMTTFPVASMAYTFSANSPVTDSAAAGTALSTGHKTGNGMLGMTPDSAEVYSLARDLSAEGYGVGILTTVGADDATPAAFLAHVPYRGMYTQVAMQMAQCGYPVLAGAGLRGLRDKDGRDTGVWDAMAQNDVTVIWTPDSIDAVDSRVLMLMPGDHDPNDMGYTIDSVPGQPTLAQMTAATIRRLSRQTPQGFFIMAEGGNIDHAAHANDGGAVIKEILAFNQAIAEAYDFYKAHPQETLIVITADHDTGGMTVGNATTGYNAFLQHVDAQRVSKEAFSSYCKGLLKSRMAYTWEDMRQYLQDNLGLFGPVKVPEAQEKELRKAFDEAFAHRNSAKDQKTLYANFNSFAALVFKVYNDLVGIGWTTPHHTGNPVPVYAIGAGAGAFSQVNNNIQIPRLIMSLMGKALK